MAVDDFTQAQPGFVEVLPAGAPRADWEKPETGRNQQKHTWVVRHDRLLFASGW